MPSTERATTMDAHPNAKILQEMADRMQAGDFAAAFDVLADDVEWHEIGRSEPTRGKEALGQRYAESVGDYEIEADVHDVIANDEHAVQLMNVTARRDGKTLEYRTAEIYHMTDGKITARWAFSDDTARIVEFFA
jgi:ketosteroid isomerase-like protein